MFYVEFLVDDEPYELELRPGMVFTKCAKCGKKIYGYWHIGVETECEACTPPPDPKKKLIEYLKKQRGVTFTEEEIDAFLRKVTLNYSLKRFTEGRVVGNLGRTMICEDRRMPLA